jgi:hypothetical protein
MIPAARVLAICASVALLIPVCGFAPGTAPGSGAKMDADIIVTAAPAYEPLAALRGQERFPKGAQLLLIHAGKAEPLAAGFAASADANVSFDGKRVLFAGKKAAGDPWQIWELTLADGSVRRLVAGEGDAIRPLYLPGGRLVYARRTPLGFQLESVEDGSPPAPKPLNPTTGPGMLPLCWLTDGFSLSLAFLSARDRLQRCIWCMPMARASSRTAAIMGVRAGAEGNWRMATWSSRMELHWPGLLRRWRTRSLSRLPMPSMRARLRRRHRAPG